MFIVNAKTLKRLNFKTFKLELNFQTSFYKLYLKKF